MFLLHVLQDLLWICSGILRNTDVSSVGIQTQFLGERNNSTEVHTEKSRKKAEKDILVKLSSSIAIVVG